MLCVTLARPSIWSDMILDASMRLFWDEIYISIDGVSVKQIALHNAVGLIQSARGISVADCLWALS